MSWRNNLSLGVFLALFALSGCGFHPLYAKKSDDDKSKLFAGVQVDPIPNRAGQQFRADLEDKLNPGGVVPTKPVYRLLVNLSTIESPIGVARDGTVSRYNVYLDSTYFLYRIADNKQISSGHLRHVSSYNNQTNSYFSTYISEEDANKRGIDELSELYRQRLAEYLDAGAPVQDPAQAAVIMNSVPALPPNAYNSGPFSSGATDNTNLLNSTTNNMNKAPF